LIKNGFSLSGHKTITNDRPPANKKSIQALFIFMVACALSTILSTDFALSFEAFFSKVFKNILLCLIVAEIAVDKYRIRNTLLAFVCSSLFILVDGGVQYFKGVDFLRHYRKDPTGLQASFSNRNSLGGWLGMLIPVFTGIFISKNLFSKTVKKILLALLLILLMVCLVVTYSRASWLGLMLSFLFMGYLYLRLLNNRRVTWLVIMMIIILSVVAFLVLPNTVKTRVTSMVRIENSNLFRINLWKESIDIIKDFPLFGAGLNTYTRVGRLYVESGGGYYPHNSYLQMAAEIGILGLLAFLWFLFNVFELGVGLFKKTKDCLLLGLLAALIVFLTQSLFDVNIYALQLATLFWIVLGLTMARCRFLTE